MLWRRSPWKISDAVEEVVCSRQDIGDAVEGFRLK
jgi:hypothetical protein